MSSQIYIIILLCVVGISTGQILFKLTSRSLQYSSHISEILFNPLFLTAMAIYGLATLVWIWSLRYIDLVAAYPLMAMSYILVPLAGHFVLGEEIGMRYWGGVVLICLGISLTVGAAGR